MTYSIKKQKIESSVQAVLNKSQILLPQSPTINGLEQLLTDIKNDYYTIVVVGEFKHGKSTFVNALLEEDLMPVDVTPTTATINAIFYGEKRELQVVKQDGNTEIKDLSQETLSHYVASADFDPNDIKYLKIFLPSPLLKNRVVLVDTPGVNDLNEHRSAITHQFIPRADAVLFMIDMRTPVKKTEEQFLKQIMNNEGIKQVIFAANFLDRMDEEEMEDVIEFIERRIQFITDGEKSTVFPLSAQEGLNAKLTKDKELHEISGLKALEQEISKLLDNGPKSNEKLERYDLRFVQLLPNSKAEIETIQYFSKQSIEELQMQLDGIQMWFQEKERWHSQLNHYINERESEIKFIVNKSINHFGERLKKDIFNRIELFNGSDMKMFMEKQLPFTIKNQFEQWIDQYNDNAQELFVKLEIEVSKGLSKSFQQTLRIQSSRQSSLYMNTDVPLIESNAGNTHVKAGLVIGGASTVALLLGASFVLPVIAMAGLPFLQSKIAQKQMEQVKPQLQYAMEEQLSLLIRDFSMQVDQYIEKNVTNIRQHSLHVFEQQVTYIKATINEQVQGNETKTQEIQLKLKELNLFAKQIEEMIEGAEAHDEPLPTA